MNEQDSNGNKKKQDYEIGYGRPPKRTQFKPGQSGNPKGRKRRPKSVQAQLRSVLAKKVPITERGKTKNVPLQEVIILNLANKAAKGDLKAVAFVVNLLHGPEYADTDTIDQTGLTPDDQAMFEEVMRQVLQTDSSDQSALADTGDAAGDPVGSIAGDNQPHEASENHDEVQGNDTQG